MAVWLSVESEGITTLWMFGGYGYGGSSDFVGYLTDLWQYNPTLEQWRWMSGGQLRDQLC